MSRARKGKARIRSKLRSLALKGGAVFLSLLLLWTGTGIWFVHHTRTWLEEKCQNWPRILTKPLLWIGDPVSNVTDAIGLTGSDAVQTITRQPPANTVLFAGLPVRKGAPAPTDIEVLDRGEFLIGWSPSLRHPVWCAYHVPAQARFDAEARPHFKKDKAVPSSPAAGDYSRTGYDRGHMVPNFAAVTRFGPEVQSRTFQMTNITPQTPQLNRGVWRNIEHRIAELWTRRWGEIWVIVGCISDGQETLSGTDIDVPTRFYQLVVAQDGNRLRALALLIEQEVPWQSWPTRYLVSIDELERQTGLDFLPNLEDPIEDALEAQWPTRLWPICFTDILNLIRN